MSHADAPQTAVPIKLSSKALAEKIAALQSKQYQQDKSLPTWTFEDYLKEQEAALLARPANDKLMQNLDESKLTAAELVEKYTYAPCDAKYNELTTRCLVKWAKERPLQMCGPIIREDWLCRNARHRVLGSQCALDLKALTNCAEKKGTNECKFELWKTVACLDADKF